MEVEWRENGAVERRLFGGNTSFGALLNVAEDYFKGREGEGVVTRFSIGEEEYTID